MFDKDRVFYKSEDYTVRMEKIGGCEHYYIKFHGQTADSREEEITLDVFMLYYKEFRKPLDNQRNEQRRHIENGEIDGFIISRKLTVTRFEQEIAVKADLDAVLKTCTPKQQRRFKLHIQGYTLTEIAEMEKCDYTSVKESVNAAKEKMKKYFF
jgi:hypothetical protein